MANKKVKKQEEIPEGNAEQNRNYEQEVEENG